MNESARRTRRLHRVVNGVERLRALLGPSGGAACSAWTALAYASGPRRLAKPKSTSLRISLPREALGIFFPLELMCTALRPARDGMGWMLVMRVGCQVELRWQ